jgi:hypothetical protein
MGKWENQRFVQPQAQILQQLTCLDLDKTLGLTKILEEAQKIQPPE